jgi:hypothetical protein
MSWLFSQALAGEYLAATFLDGEPCVPSSGNPIQQAYCAPDKMTDFSRLSRFGMTYKPLTEDRGEALLMSYREGFLVRTSLLQEPEQGLTESDQECGKKWHGSFTKYDPDSCSWRTHQCLLLGDLELFSGIWPRWGLMRSGECWELPTLAHPTNERESGLSGKWPTPTAHNAKEGAFPAEYNRKTLTLAAEVGGKLNPSWVEWLMGWPLGWTDLKRLETDKFQKWLDEHGSY